MIQSIQPNAAANALVHNVLVSKKNISIASHSQLSTEFSQAVRALGMAQLNQPYFGKISFDYVGADAKTIGADHGLDIEKLFITKKAAVANAVNKLVTESTMDGKWSKWVNLDEDNILVKEVQDYATSVKGKFDDIVLLGTGGSSLGGSTLFQSLTHSKWNDSKAARKDNPRFHVVENADSDELNDLTDILNRKRTLFLVISKSGTTTEPMTAFSFFKNWVENGAGDVQGIGQEAAKQNFVTITDQDASRSVLRQITDKEGYQSFVVPDDVGGRYSVFSAVGLLPAALLGLDLKEMQRGIKDIKGDVLNLDIEKNPAAQNALIHTAMMQDKGKSVATMLPYSAKLKALGDWHAQNWGESLGKKKNIYGKIVYAGQTPTSIPMPMGQHSQVQLFNEGPNDKLFSFIHIKEPQRQAKVPSAMSEIEKLKFLADKSFTEITDAQFNGTRGAFIENKRPSVTYTLPKLDAYHLAQLMYTLEIQTALTGHLLEVNPFDQPGVETGKTLTKNNLKN